ncbi:MAG: hypothetical protein VW405_12495 [Rhodospirillaceae bacterium]
MSDDDDFEDLTDAPRRSVKRYGVLFATEGAVADVEDWLDDSCEGDWSLIVEGMDEDLIRKSLKITFELEADKLRFINEYARA